MLFVSETDEVIVLGRSGIFIVLEFQNSLKDVASE